MGLDWSLVVIIIFGMIISIPVVYIAFNSPPFKALGKIVEALASRIARKTYDTPDPELAKRIGVLERELSRRERAEALAQRVGPEETERLKRQFSGAKGTVTILFSDIEDFSRFVDRGDEVAYEILQIHNRIFRDQIKQHNGTEVKNYGDGFMVSFASARQAIECALGIQEYFKSYNFKHIDPIRVRMGINSGEPIQEDGDYIGRTVNLAARIADCARGGEIWTSEIVRSLVGSARGFQFIARGGQSLQGFSEPLALFEVMPIEALESPEKRELEQRLKELEARLKDEMKG